MKQSIQIIFFSAIILVAKYSTAQTFTYQNTLTPSQLVQNVLVGNGITAFNVTYNGSLVNASSTQVPVQSFAATGLTTAFTFGSGVYLRTQNAPVITDPDLASIASGTVTNGVILEFDFIATGDTLNFEYVFASSEYSGYTCSSFNDAFGFFLSGPGITGSYTGSAVNLALVPGTNIPVTINTVNSGVSSSGSAANCLAADSNFVANNVYFTTSNGTFSGQGYNGSTTSLLAVSNLQCGGVYHIKMAICNVADQALNSGVYLKAQSFVSNVVTIETESQIVGSFTDTLLAEGCVSTQLKFIRPSFYNDSVQTFDLTYTGTASIADYNPLPNQVVFPIGVDTVTFTITPVADGITEPMEWLQVKGYTVTVCGDTIYDSLIVYFVDHYDFTYTVPDTVFAVCISDTPLVEVLNIVGSVGPYQTIWSFGDTINPTYFPNNGIHPDTIQYTIDVVDICGWHVIDSVILVVDSIPPAFIVSPGNNLIANCTNDDKIVNAVLTSPTIGPYTYTWSNGTVGPTTTLTDNDINDQTLIFTVSLTDGCGTVITDTVTLVTDYQVPEFTILPNDTLYASCPTSLLTATASLTYGTYGPYTFLWTNGATTAVTQLANNGIIGGQTWYYVTSTNLCGMSTLDSVLVINNFIEPVLQILPNDTLTVDCLPDSALATVVITAGTGGPYIYSWSNGATTNSTYIHDGGVNNTDIPFTVSVTNGCGFTGTKNGVLQVRKTLAIDSTFSSPTAVCAATGTVAGPVSGQTGVANYVWMGPSPSTTTYTTATVNNLPAGTYILTATDNVCSVAGNVTVQTLPAPVADAWASPDIGFEPLGVTVYNNSLNATSYVWDFGNGQTANTSNLASVWTEYTVAGVYTIELIAFDASGCSDTTYLDILVNPNPPVYPPIWEIPNVFSPNGDLVNDFFIIKTENVETIDMQISNRWGNVMYDFTGPIAAWNGLTKAGNPAEDGVYFYKIKLTGISGDVVNLDGFLQLVR